MSYQTQVSRVLDDEHRANLELLARVEHAFSRSPGAGDEADTQLAQLAAAFGRYLAQDVGRHFEFEEQELFPRIREVARELAPLAQAAAAGTLDAAGWRTLRSGALEMVERQVAHIQKETMALLPLLDDLLDEDDDRELAFAYASG